MAGFFDQLGLFGKAPDVKTVAVDQGTQDLLNKGVDNAIRPTEQFHQDINANVDKGAASIGAGKTGEQTDAGLANTPGFTQALRDKYATMNQKDINDLKFRNKQQAEMTRADQMHKMAMAAMGQQRAATQNYQMLSDAYNQNEAARAQFVNELFQTGSYAAGRSMAKRKKTTTQPDADLNIASEGTNYDDNFNERTV